MRKIGFILIGAVAAILFMAIIRYFAVTTAHNTHYHANFALFLNGQRVDFSQPKYSEDIPSCVTDEEILPQQRVHLHENNPDIVHVHHSGVTWGHLLANLGFTLGPNHLIDDQGNIYQKNDSQKLSFIINGKVTANPYNTKIENEDRLLIDFGTESAEELVVNKFLMVAQNAPEYNAKHDPAGCAGDENLGFAAKLQKALFF